LKQWEETFARMEDQLARWLDAWLDRHPAWDGWLEAHLHAYGIHGPQARHLLKARVVPAALLLLGAILALVVLLAVRRARRPHRRRRRSQLGRPRPITRPGTVQR
jgi:hypothetical protein